MMNRREFLFSAGAVTLVSGCRSLDLFGAPEMTSVVMPDGHRVRDYEIRAVPLDGSQPLVKCFLSPAYAKMAKYEPERQRFWFDVAELPQDKEYRIEIRARNCFGKASAPLVSEVWRGKPGLDKAKG